jgi:hypothetical protein
MMPELIEYLGNSTTSVAKQGKYRITMNGATPVVEVVIETMDDMRVYPASSAHPELVGMVNKVKQAAGFSPGGAFYINEFQQVIVPATDDSTSDRQVRYYLAGEYRREIILELDGEQFTGRPIDSNGRPLRPHGPWEGKPRPGIGYKLKAGGQDIEFLVQISPGREKIHKLSKIVGNSAARKTAAYVAAVKGTRGGKFYINEHRAMFCPVSENDFSQWKFIGVLDDSLPWFPKWTPDEETSESNKPSVAPARPVHAAMPQTSNDVIRPVPRVFADDPDQI